MLSGEYVLHPDTYSFGGGIGQRRILGTSLYTSVTGAVIYGRATGAIEGSRGQFVFGDPLRESDQRWAFGTSVYWDDEIDRHLLASGRTQTYDAPSTPQTEALPVEYRAQRYVGGYEAVRSYGVLEKYDVSFGSRSIGAKTRTFPCRARARPPKPIS